MFCTRGAFVLNPVLRSCCDTHNLQCVANVSTNVHAIRTNMTQQAQTFLYTPHGDGCHGRPSAYAVRPGKHRRLKRMHFWTKSKSWFSLGVERIHSHSTIQVISRSPRLALHMRHSLLAYMGGRSFPLGHISSPYDIPNRRGS